MTLILNCFFRRIADGVMKKSPFRQTTLALRSPQGGVRPGRWRLDGRGISLQCNE